MHGPYDQVNALVLVTGPAARRTLLLVSRGARVQVLDEGDGAASAVVAERLRGAGASVRFGVGELPDEPFDVCVTSPGFTMQHPWIVACRTRGLPVISELELGARYWPGRVLAVTGSKGKSSLVKLCAIVELSGRGRVASRQLWNSHSAGCVGAAGVMLGGDGSQFVSDGAHADIQSRYCDPVNLQVGPS